MELGESFGIFILGILNFVFGEFIGFYFCSCEFKIQVIVCGLDCKMEGSGRRPEPAGGEIGVMFVILVFVDWIVKQEVRIWRIKPALDIVFVDGIVKRKVPVGDQNQRVVERWTSR